MVRKPSPERRTKYLSSALKLFVENGVQHTSTAAISREAGTAAGTLFLYFPTKQDLIHELLLEINKQHSAAIKALLKPSLSVRETFFAIWDGSIRWFLENQEAYQYIQQVRDSGLIDEANVVGPSQTTPNNKNVKIIIIKCFIVLLQFSKLSIKTISHVWGGTLKR